MSGFGVAMLKTEGESVQYDELTPARHPMEIETTYVERRVPRELETEAHKLIDTWLRSKGYKPSEL